MDNQVLIDNITAACEAKGEKVTPACVAAGVGKSFISNLRRGQSPSVASVAALADYLGVTTSALLGEKEPDGQTAAELPDPLDAQLTDLLRRADPETKRAMIVLLQQRQKPE